VASAGHIIVNARYLATKRTQ